MIPRIDESTELEQKPISSEGEKGDPRDIRKNNVHRHIAAHKKNAVTEAIGRSDSLCSDQK